MYPDKTVSVPFEGNIHLSGGEEESCRGGGGGGGIVLDLEWD